MALTDRAPFSHTPLLSPCLLSLLPPLAHLSHTGGCSLSLSPSHYTQLQPELYTRWRQHILLDLSRVVGLDATAARAFAELRHVLDERDAVLGYAGMRPAVHALLEVGICPSSDGKSCESKR